MMGKIVKQRFYKCLGFFLLTLTHRICIDVTEHKITPVSYTHLGVAGTADHCKIPIALFGEQHAVAVIGQKGIFQLIEGLEIKGIADARCV